MPAPEDHAHPVEDASTTGGVPIAPALAPALEGVGRPRLGTEVDARVLAVSALACAIGAAAALLARLLSASLALVTNLAFHGQLSFAAAAPTPNALGAWGAAVPVVGALAVGLLARYGSAAIRGHGIPEAMEQVLFHQSRIPARVLVLKPLSAVIAIGTGGPFGAEGPIIATGGALGSLVGQLVRISAEERKVLLASGAAAGMAATFGTPVAAVLLAIELLLFEYRPRSIVPVALASVTAAAVRVALVGSGPAFAVRAVADAPAPALLGYLALGAVLGVAAVGVTKLLYAIEDGFARLPVHWMWWPALGAIPVGLVGLVAPRTLGVGYDNIEGMVSGTVAGAALYALCAWKLVSWACALGSGTSGGTLAPLLTIGGGLGAACASALAAFAPAAGLDPRLGALVGMAALFAGASRAPLASVLFALEATRQPGALLAILAGCSAAYLVSCALMRHSIMSEKIARRGRPVPAGYLADELAGILVRDVGLRPVATLHASRPVAEARAWIASGAPGSAHQGFPVVDTGGGVVGVVTRRDLAGAGDARTVGELVRRPPVRVAPEATLREAADAMVAARVGRLPVVDGAGRLVGILTRSDVLEAHRHRLVREHHRERVRRVGRSVRRAPA